MSMTEPSGLLKPTVLGANMTHKICDACETVQHCSNHGCVPIQQLAAAEGHHEGNGYELSTKENYEVFAAQRNKLSGLSGPPPLTYEEAIHELWYLRRRVKQLERQVFEMGWQISGESMGR